MPQLNKRTTEENRDTLDEKIMGTNKRRSNNGSQLFMRHWGGNFGQGEGFSRVISKLAFQIYVCYLYTCI